MADFKYKLYLDQVAYLAEEFNKVQDYKAESLQQVLVFSVFDKLHEKLQIKLIKAKSRMAQSLRKGKVSLSLTETEAIAILMLFNWRLPKIPTDTYAHSLMCNIRDSIADKYPFQ